EIVDRPAGRLHLPRLSEHLREEVEPAREPARAVLGEPLEEVDVLVGETIAEAEALAIVEVARTGDAEPVRGEREKREIERSPVEVDEDGAVIVLNAAPEALDDRLRVEPRRVECG